MSQNNAPQWYPQFPPQPPKKHTVRNVILVLGVLLFLGVAGCAAVMASIGNELAKQADAPPDGVAPSAASVPSDSNVPRPVPICNASS